MNDTFMKKTFIYFICFLSSFPLAAQKSYYVKTGGTQDGTSWNLASGDLQATIEKAAAGDAVYVAAGTYSGGFFMKEGVQVKGGYTANSGNPTERYEVQETTDPAKQSILDGGGIQRVLTQITPFSILTTWEGFVIQNGNPSVEFKKGSVIYSSLGDFKIIGILYKYDSESRQGMMFGTEEIIKQWGGYAMELPGLASISDAKDARNDLSGIEHSYHIVNALKDHCADFSQADYPMNGNYAAFWCDTLTSGGYTDWHLPSTGELQEIYDAGINSIMRSLGKKLNYGYWSSSQVGNTLAWAYYFGNGLFHPALKYVSHIVSAVCPFTAPEHPGSIYVAGGGALIKENGILKNCVVKNNQSPSQGGGVYVGINGQLDNCIVEGNEAPEGKEIYYETSTGLIPLVNDNEAFNIYPNPVNAGGQIKIKINDCNSIYYRFINSSGATVKDGTGGLSLTVPTQKGVYLLQLQTDNKKYKAKVIVH